MRSPLKRLAPFIAGAIASAVAFVGVYLLFVRTYIGQVVDERAFSGANEWHNGIVTFARQFLDALPAASIGLAIVIALTIVAVRRNWSVLAIAVLAAAGANGSTQLLKYTILSRPQTGVADGLSNSLPSGHTTVAASAALVLLMVASPRFRPLIAIIGSLFAVVAGAATLINQWHRPSDVIAGFLVVAFWACIAGCLLVWMRVKTAPRSARSRIPLLVWVAVACAVVAGVGLVVTYVSATQGGSHLLIAYIGGVSAIAAVGFALGAMSNRAFHWLA
jgi:membrane-associated phospholipid phosphatase